MTRRELAIDAFWTERPLMRRFIATTGRTSFSLRELIAFAELLPDGIFIGLQKRRGERSQRPPHVAAPTRRPLPKTRRRGNLTLIEGGGQ